MAGKNTFTRLSENLLNQTGQFTSASETSSGKGRILYPAIVRDVEDQAGQNRIKAEIVTMGDDGKISPGKDKDLPLSRLPICIPMFPEHIHVRPQVGECVFVLAENPNDLTSPRFWFGPVITSQLKLPYQSYEESINIFNPSSYKDKAIFDIPTLQNQAKQNAVLPSQNDVALQGKQDADVVLRPREIEMRVGKFKTQSVTELNDLTPCRIQLKQIDNFQNKTGIRNVDEKLSKEFVPFSQIMINATNINIYSPQGKFREFDSTNEENQTNLRLKDYGELASRLHPAVFGDELVKLLRLIIQYLLTHIHTPQNPSLKNNISAQLEPYLSSGKMQDLLSNHVRLN